MSDDLASDGLWLSISDVAREKNVTRQAIAKRVDALVEAGKLETRPGPAGTKLVNLAQYDLAVGEVGDAARELGAETKADDEPSSNPAYRDHQAREKQYSADLKFLELQQRLGKLVEREDVERAADEAGELLVAVVDRLPTHAERIAAAVGKDGPSGARVALKEIAREVRTALADAIGRLGMRGALAQLKAEADDSTRDDVDDLTRPDQSPGAA
jgi:DNA-binding IscR family transcriptional regulator